MKQVTTNPSFQGDLMIRRVAKTEVPVAKLTVDCAINGMFMLAHSETGHHHVVAEQAARHLIDQMNTLISYLEVLEPCEVEHLRDRDVHEQLYLEPGWYELHRQRELEDDGLWRPVTD